MKVVLKAEWSKAQVFVRSATRLSGVFGPWFQLEIENEWELPRRDFPFMASSGCKYRQHVGCPLSKDI